MVGASWLIGDGESVLTSSRLGSGRVPTKEIIDLLADELFDALRLIVVGNADRGNAHSIERLDEGKFQRHDARGIDSQDW